MNDPLITNEVGYILHVFNHISMSDFESLLGIINPSFLEYSKCSNQSVRYNLYKLAEIAELFEKANIERLDSFMHRDIVDGKTLFEIIQDNICSPVIDLDKVIAIVKNISDKEAATRKESKGSVSSLRSLEEVMNEFSTPISYD